MNKYKMVIDIIEDKYLPKLDQIHNYLKAKYVFGYDIEELYILWIKYSNDNGAGFLAVNEKTMNDFIRWLKI